MFAPVGYRTIESIEWLIMEAADRVWPMGIGQELPQLPNGHSDYRYDSTIMNSLSCFWLRNFVFSSYKCPKYLASPQGQILKAGYGFFELTAEGKEFDEFFSQTHSIPKPECFPSIHALNKIYPLIMKPQFLFFSPDIGIIEVSDKVKLDKYSLLDLPTVKNFEGWALVFKENDFPASADDLLKFAERVTNSDNASKGLGRPRKAERAARAYLGRYPNGHGKKTWAEIEDEFGCHSKTIRNGIKLLEGKIVE